MYHFTRYFSTIDANSQEQGGQERERAKKHKLEYLYQAGPGVALYPLLGSCLRALGKGWTVQVLSTHHLSPFSALQNLLKDPEKLLLENLADESVPASLEETKANLVLIDAVDSPHTIKALRDRLLGKAHLMVGGDDPLPDDYDLISRFLSQDLQKQGVLSFTGPGKGKSSSAFGVALQAAVQGERAAIVQWFKEPKGPRGTWSINEHYFPEELRDPTRVEFYPTGAGFFGSANLDRVQGPEAYAYHRNAALQGATLATELIASGQYRVVVLDELVDTLSDISQNIPQSLLDEKVIRDLLSLSLNHPAVKVVVTGRRVTPHWADLIQRSYVIEEIRHPWSSRGKAAISGLDF